MDTERRPVYEKGVPVIEGLQIIPDQIVSNVNGYIMVQYLIEELLKMLGFFASVIKFSLLLFILFEPFGLVFGQPSAPSGMVYIPPGVISIFLSIIAGVRD